MGIKSVDQLNLSPVPLHCSRSPDFTKTYDQHPEYFSSLLAFSSFHHQTLLYSSYTERKTRDQGFEAKSVNDYKVLRNFQLPGAVGEQVICLLALASRAHYLPL